MSIGVIGRFSILEIALSYEHLFMPDRTVEVGEGEAYRLMAQAGSYPDTVNQDVPINEGHFEGGYDIVGFSLGFRFDRPSRSDDDDEAGDEVEAAAPAGDTTGGEPAVDEAAPADDAPGDESSGETPASDSDGEEMPLEAI